MSAYITKDLMQELYRVCTQKYKIETKTIRLLNGDIFDSTVKPFRKASILVIPNLTERQIKDTVEDTVTKNDTTYTKVDVTKQAECDNGTKCYILYKILDNEYTIRSIKIVIASTGNIYRAVELSNALPISENVNWSVSKLVKAYKDELDSEINKTEADYSREMPEVETQFKQAGIVLDTMLVKKFSSDKNIVFKSNIVENKLAKLKILYDLQLIYKSYNVEVYKYKTETSTCICTNSQFYLPVDCTGLFRGLNIKELDFSEFNTDHVKIMAEAFENCDIDKINFKYFNGKIVNMEGMLKAANIKEIDITNLYTKSIKTMDEIFIGSMMNSSAIGRMFQHTSLINKLKISEGLLNKMSKLNSKVPFAFAIIKDLEIKSEGADEERINNLIWELANNEKIEKITIV